MYGDATPVIVEWRRARAERSEAFTTGTALDRADAKIRLLELEIALVEEHGLTLPPEIQPLRGFGRKGQTNWRWTALHDTRRASARRRLWRWVRRVCTLGLWWK